MSDHHDNHHQESPKKVFFGVPIAFAIAFWIVTILCLKACDHPKHHCGKDSECKMENCDNCSAECKAKCEEDKSKLKEGEKVETGQKTLNADAPNGKDKKPDSPNAIEGEKSPVEKEDSAKRAH
jgi:hypothetical protein